MTPCLALPNDRNRDQASAQTAANLKWSLPSYTGAYHFAREAAFSSMRADNRDKMNAKDKAAGDAIMCRLLWLVEASEGGFDGLDDAALTARCARYRLSMKHVVDAQYAPGSWPAAAAQQAAA